MTAKNPKKIAVYVPLGLQAEVRKVADKHELGSFSAALRVIMRLGITTLKDLDKLDRSDVYLPFVEREKGDD
jgi:hypothetical protein|tara:strand:- start:514 stop:729 length:216 start_codon:yes stop_codon:yes gene_type:complete